MTADGCALNARLIQELGMHDITVRGFVQRITATNYTEFLDALYSDLNLALGELEKSPGDDEAEDATTHRLLLVLRGMGYSATHDAHAGGHVDITVEMKRKNFSWIGEAKRFTSVADLTEGYLQLATRYRPQLMDGKLHGGLIGYLRRPDAASHMKNWREHFASINVAAGAVTRDCDRRGPLAFHSSHPHQDFGIPLEVWHTCVVLHFHPRDKSGRTAKKYRTAPGKQGGKA